MTEDPPPDRPVPAYIRAARGNGTVRVVGLAMLAVGEILEPEKATVEIVHPGDDEPGDDPFELDFGDLPALG